MLILALEVDVENADSSCETPALLREEAARVWELVQAGVIREIHFRADRSAAVLHMETASLEAAERALATLPLVRSGLIRFDLIPLRAYPGFARLFA